MTEELKQQLLQSLHVIAKKNNIPNVEQISFKKRNSLLELIKVNDEPAYQLITNLIDAALKLDRINNDKEKQEKKPDHWKAEIEKVQQEYTEAEELLKKFLIRE